MKTYIKFIISNFSKSIIQVFLIMLSLIIILNILTEIDFFKDTEVSSIFPIYVSLLNSPTLIFEMFPFIFLISTQVFFINLLNDNQIQVFKYSGLKNSQILKVLTISSFFIGIFLVLIFYNFSSNLKNIYLELKNKYTLDDKYLAVVTKNGLWIRDVINEDILIINSKKIDDNFLIDAFITQFNKDYEVIRNIRSQKIDISTNQWIAFDAKIYENNISTLKKKFRIESNFNYKKVQGLFSNLSSLSLLELIDLRKNYKSLNYSTTEVDLQLQKVISYPIYLALMTILSAIIMFGTKNYSSSTFKISIGLFASVLIYYMNNFFYVLGKTEKISLNTAIWIPLFILIFINTILIFRINEK